MPVNWKQIRSGFPSLRNWTYLNTATYGQVSLSCQAAVAKHFARRDELACADFLSWFDDIDEIRSLAARLIACMPTDIAFCENSATALSLFLGGIDWCPGDRMVTMRDEFPNQYYYANTLGGRGVEVRELAEIETLPERTRAVVMSTASYITGRRPDLARIVRLAREAGALSYIDGTQTVGALRFSIAEVQPDFFAVNAYKWMLSPNGATLFYVSPELRRTLAPSVIGWRSDRNWRSVDSLNTGVPEFSENADRYEGGMLNFPSLYAMGESIRLMLEIGPEVIERRVLELASATAEMLRANGATILNENTNILAAHWPDRDASALSRQLREKRVITSARHGNLRVSAHFYNDESDIEALEAALRS